MRFLRLKLEHFASIAAAQIEFGPGLNVLFGPNEFGKSTIAEAIRAALLLQPSSKAHEPFVRWNCDDTPRVELVFETEPQRIWRVIKSFGSGAKGKSELDESKDGVHFSSLAKGRDVDGKLRKLLNWGIPEPGGAGGVHGLPETYLTAVLLPNQEGVSEIFCRDVGSDYDESGRQLLTNALLALAKDPLFAKVMKESQSRVDEAFTSKGVRKRGKHSPWEKISAEIAQAGELVRSAKEDEAKSEAVRMEVKNVHDQWIEAQSAYEAARLTFAARQKAFDDQRQVEDKRKAAQGELERVEGIHQTVANIEKQETEFSAAVRSLDEQLTTAAKAVADADADEKTAQDAVRQASSEETAAQRELLRRGCENELLKLQSQEKAECDSIAKANRVHDLAEKVASAGADLAKRSRAFDEQGLRAKRILSEIELLRGVELWQRKQDLLNCEREAKAAAKIVQDTLLANDALTAELKQLEDWLEQVRLPNADQLRAIKKLHEDLRVGEAQVDVGLALEITPQRPLEIHAAADRQPAVNHALSDDALTIEAQRLIELTIPGLANVVIRGGNPQARNLVAKLSARWQQEVEPVLHAARVKTVQDVEDARRDADEATRRAEKLRQDLRWNGRQIESHVKTADSAAAIGQELAAISQQLSSFDAGALTEQARSLTAAGATDVPHAIRAKIDDRTREHQGLQLKLAGEKAAIDQLKDMLGNARRELEVAEKTIEGSCQQVLAHAQGKLTHLLKQKTDCEAKLKSLETEGTSNLLAAQQKLDSAQAALAKAQHDQQKVLSQRTELVGKLENCRGELNVRRQLASAADLATARGEVEQAQEELTELRRSGIEITADGLEAERTTLERQADDVRKSQEQLTGLAGALKHVGGNVARERHSSYHDAWQQKIRKEEEMGIDYDAWRLLLETLREAENAEAAHLGKAIGGPVSKRFGELTAGRYGAMQLGPALESQGIVAQGETRDLNRLSTGTREQLSTILRLSLAEQLGCVLLLDDQLAQSDPQRMQWFRETLRSAARTTQIVVLTCRPGDYLLPCEIVPGQPYLDSEQGAVRVASVEKLVTR